MSEIPFAFWREKEATVSAPSSLRRSRSPSPRPEAPKRPPPPSSKLRSSANAPSKTDSEASLPTSSSSDGESLGAALTRCWEPDGPASSSSARQPPAASRGASLPPEYRLTSSSSAPEKNNSSSSSSGSGGGKSCSLPHADSSSAVLLNPATRRSQGDGECSVEGPEGTSDPPRPRLAEMSAEVRRPGRGASVLELREKIAPLLTSPARRSTFAPNPREPHPSSTQSLHGKVRRVHSDKLSLRDPDSSHRQWRSLSASKRRSMSSVKIQSSGFTSYLALDCPAPSPSRDNTQSRDPPSPSPHHLTSPLIPQGFSELFKTSGEPSRDYLEDAPTLSSEETAFWDMVKRLHSQFCDDVIPRLEARVLSQQLVKPHNGRRHDSVSVMAGRTSDTLTVSMETKQGVTPIVFECSAQCTAREVVMKALKRPNQEGCGLLPSNCLVKVCGRDEYLDSKRQLCDYEYVYQCRKFSADVRLVLVERTPERKAGRPSPPPSAKTSPVGHKHAPKQEVNNLLDSYFAKVEKFCSILPEMKSIQSLPLLAQSVVSCVKLLCERLWFVETPDVSEAVYNLRRACKAATQEELDPDTLTTLEESCSVDEWVAITPNGSCLTAEQIKDIMSASEVLSSAVKSLVTLYCASYLPGYAPVWWEGPVGVASVAMEPGFLRMKVCALHGVRPLEQQRSEFTAVLQQFDMFQLEVCVYHDGRTLSKKTYSPPAKPAHNFFTTVIWNKWLNLGLLLSAVPLEARVCFTLHGLEMPGSGYKWNRRPVAWATHRLFSSDRVLIGGARLLGLWEGDSEADPLDSPYPNTSRQAITLQVEFDHYDGMSLQFPELSPGKRDPAHPGPPPNVRLALKNLAQKDRFYSPTHDETALLWSNRFSCPPLLSPFSRGLPALLVTTPTWHASQPRADVLGVLGAWPTSDPTFGLELLDPHFSEECVRSKAVSWLAGLTNDDFCDYLPQLVQCVRHDSCVGSALAELLLTRAAQSQRIAHYLYWHLQLTDAKFAQRYSLLLDAMETLCREELWLEFSNQVELVEQLCVVASAVKQARDAHRQTTLITELRGVADKFVGTFRLPLDPALLVRGVDVDACSFFSSNTVPLRLAFLNADPCGDNIDILFKVGDDLRQDILVLQMIRLMDKLWLRAGLDLKMVTYRCVATGPERGMLELVTEASTLRAIQTEHGVTGSFKDRPLYDWLKRYNRTDSAYKQAVENFTLSCAGYCVATYILGICDRHNDNIMVRKAGHMFHIDFGKILGNAQMFGNIRRDRVPFVLTKDMAYVINDGDRPTEHFQKFTDLCCSAFSEVRKHSSLVISLLSLMLSSGLTELSSLDDIQYVRDALLPGRSEAEATYAFTKYIEDSLGAMATQINFFIHNLAQFKFHSGSSGAALLSFCPQAYSIATDGKITMATITSYHKRYFPERHYVYHVEVGREGCAECSHVFRRYREFDEFQSKLVQCFPSEPLPRLPGKIFIPGKSSTRQTSEKRSAELNTFLGELLRMEARVAESDIVYTFLHCLVRDIQDLARIQEEEEAEEVVTVGRVKLALSYHQHTLTVMVKHVRDLVPREGYDTADPYVKLYLLPDASKLSKKKTKVAKRTLNPTYNETFTYALPASSLPSRSLQLSVWDASLLLNKQCMAVVAIEMATLHPQLVGGGATNWYDLLPVSSE